MPFSVPTVKKGKKYTVPPAGRYDATIIGLSPEIPETGGGRLPEAGDYYVIEWEFEAEDRRWTIVDNISEEDLGDILIDCGLGGQEVELADAIGKKANIQIRTYGGRTSAGVAGVDPIA